MSKLMEMFFPGAVKEKDLREEELAKLREILPIYEVEEVQRILTAIKELRENYVAVCVADAGAGEARAMKSAGAIEALDKILGEEEYVTARVRELEDELEREFSEGNL